MRRFLLAASIALFAGGVAAQPATSTWELDYSKAQVSVAKAKLGLSAGAIQWNAAKPEQSTLALSLDTTTIADDAVKAELDAQHFPEMRIITSGPGRVRGGKITLPVMVTVDEISKPGNLVVSYKSEPRLITMHAEGTLRASDFKLKGGNIALVIDAPFKPNSGE